MARWQRFKTRVRNVRYRTRQRFASFARKIRPGRRTKARMRGAASGFLKPKVLLMIIAMGALAMILVHLPEIKQKLRIGSA